MSDSHTISLWQPKAWSRHLEGEGFLISRNFRATEGVLSASNVLLKIETKHRVNGIHINGSPVDLESGPDSYDGFCQACVLDVTTLLRPVNVLKIELACGSGGATVDSNELLLKVLLEIYE